MNTIFYHTLNKMVTYHTLRQLKQNAKETYIKNSLEY